MQTDTGVICHVKQTPFQFLNKINPFWWLYCCYIPWKEWSLVPQCCFTATVFVKQSHDSGMSHILIASNNIQIHQNIIHCLSDHLPAYPRLTCNDMDMQHFKNTHLKQYIISTLQRRYSTFLELATLSGAETKQKHL